ncbi:MAG TPA: cytochrome b N-terminal domain-containing protein [Thermoanaerobaculia bacterium]|nr:cytochrome b N-terminal domain-containing protein [Thermoanaerobaculia bacterium]HQN09121.1 cytochrome b N-terminal domain-containing protein [Thermoanaerobaculia bacterium]HQP87482.1 cytochrome b N-terminal domain-containing protein [Thermoanaerobaculia bacterium]
MSAKTEPPASSSAPGVHPKPFWSFRPRSDREAGDAVVSNFLLHWFPAKTYKPSLDWSYSFWLGTASAALFFLLVLSGLPLLLLYVPSVERAYGSVKDIEFVVTFGSWIRAVHRIAAHLMVAAVFLHLVRVFLTGAYKNGTGRGQRREWNWVLGVVMIVLTLFLSFTGYLLPWDQLAYWAVTVGTNIASSVPFVGPQMRELLIGGRTIDQATLIRFYVLHVIFLPAGLGALLAYHMWRIRKDGGLAKADRWTPTQEKTEASPAKSKTYSLLGVARGQAPAIRAVTLEARDTTVNSVNDLVRRISIVVLGTFAVVSILACFVPSPLEEPANPMITPNPAKAPWYFLWLQEIVTDTTLKIGSFTINGAFLGGVILPTLLLGLLTVWPWLDRSPAGAAGVWFHSSRRRQNLVFLLVVLLVLAFTIVGTFLRGPYWNFYWPWEAWPELPTRI